MIHQPPPEPQSKTPAAAPEWETMPDGRVGFPSTFRYRWTVDGIEFKAPCPPKPFGEPRDGSKLGSNLSIVLCPPYQYEIYDQAAYDALSRAGWLTDPRHTGRGAIDLVDNRPAPQ